MKYDMRFYTGLAILLLASSLSARTAQEYLPGVEKSKYYKPKENGYEKNIKSYLQKLQTLIQKTKSIEPDKREV